MNVSTEPGLALCETFVRSFFERGLFRHVRQLSLAIDEIQLGGFYTNQSPECASIQRHFAKMNVNMPQFRSVFSQINSELPKGVLRNMSGDMEFCMKYHPNSATETSKISQIGSQFASIFALSAFWSEITPSQSVHSSRFCRGCSLTFQVQACQKGDSSCWTNSSAP